jgi:hypothetical protein
VKSDNTLLLVTEASAVAELTVSYLKLIQITRAVNDLLHRVCETIRMLYPLVDKLVVNGKKIPMKSPARTEFYKQSSHHIIPQVQELHVWEPGWMPLYVM